MPDETTYDILRGMSGDQVVAIIVIIVLLFILIISNYKKISGVFNDLYNSRKNKEILKQTIIENKDQIKQLKETDTKLEESVNQLASLLQNAMAEIKSELKNMRNENEDARIDQMRTDILDFCNACGKRNYEEDAYKHIFDLHEKYIKILDRRGEENGQVDASYKVMLTIYQEHVKNGDFIGR